MCGTRDTPFEVKVVSAGEIPENKDTPQVSRKHLLRGPFGKVLLKMESILLSGPMCRYISTGTCLKVAE